MELSQIRTKFELLSGKAFGQLFIKKQSNEQLHRELTLSTKFLDQHYSDIPMQQRFYHFWFNRPVELCPKCKKVKEFNGRSKFSLNQDENYKGTCTDVVCQKWYNAGRTKEAILAKYGVENISQTQHWHDRVRQTNQKKYGVDYPTQMADHQDKMRITSLAKNGVEHHAQLQSVQDAKRSTNKVRYGVGQVMQNASIKEKAQQTNIERYGGISSMCSDATKEKSKKTMQERYGVDWYTQTEGLKTALRKRNIEKYGVSFQMQDAGFFTKNMYRKKEYVFPSGRLEKLQGYEHVTVNKLLADGMNEDNIVLGAADIEKFIDRIWYMGEDNKKHKYYPDMYLKNENKVIETKSWYTLNAHRKMNEAKKQAILALGILFEFWVYDTKGVLTVIN